MKIIDKTTGEIIKGDRKAQIIQYLLLSPYYLSISEIASLFGETKLNISYFITKYNLTKLQDIRKKRTLDTVIEKIKKKYNIDFKK